MPRPTPPHPWTGPLDRTGGTLWRKAADVLRRAVADGGLPPGTTLPVEADLARGFVVSLITVRQALRELEAEGLISKRNGRAAVVTGGPPRVARLAHTLEDVAADAGDTRLEVFDYRPRDTPEATRALLLPPGTRCPCLHARLLADGHPVTEVHVHFPPAIGDRLALADFDDRVVFRTVQRRLGIRLSGAQVTVGAQVADRRLAEWLGVAPGSAVLVSTLLYRDEAGTPVEWTVARQPGDRHKLTYELRA